jgi:hypothetical protein
LTSGLKIVQKVVRKKQEIGYTQQKINWFAKKTFT